MVQLLFTRLPTFTEDSHSVDDTSSMDQVINHDITAGFHWGGGGTVAGAGTNVVLRYLVLCGHGVDIHFIPR